MFDQLIDDINEFNENLDYHYPLPTQKQVLVVSKSVPIIHVSRHSNRNQDSQGKLILMFYLYIYKLETKIRFQKMPSIELFISILFSLLNTYLCISILDN